MSGQTEKSVKENANKQKKNAQHIESERLKINRKVNGKESDTKNVEKRKRRNGITRTAMSIIRTSMTKSAGEFENTEKRTTKRYLRYICK